jgi:hypothetical protein
VTLTVSLSREDVMTYSCVAGATVRELDLFKELSFVPLDIPSDKRSEVMQKFLEIPPSRVPYPQMCVFFKRKLSSNGCHLQRVRSSGTTTGLFLLSVYPEMETQPSTWCPVSNRIFCCKPSGALIFKQVIHMWVLVLKRMCCS